jgi:hypothetical protein
MLFAAAAEAASNGEEQGKRVPKTVLKLPETGWRDRWSSTSTSNRVTSLWSLTQICAREPSRA